MVGEILSVERHPDADKLVVCQVNVGQTEPVQIVTGAPNITKESVGARVPVVLDGGRVAGAMTAALFLRKALKSKKAN